MQRYTVYFIWKLLYMFRVVATTHHQERKQLYLQHLIFVTPLQLPAATCIAVDSNNGPLLLPAAIAADSNNGLTNTRCCRYRCMRS